MAAPAGITNCDSQNVQEKTKTIDVTDSEVSGYARNLRVRKTRKVAEKLRKFRTLRKRSEDLFLKEKR